MEALVLKEANAWCLGIIFDRFSYCAICCLSLLKRLNKIDLKKATDFVASCKNFDGGFGCTPGGESHAGQSLPLTPYSIYEVKLLPRIYDLFAGFISVF